MNNLLIELNKEEWIKLLAILDYNINQTSLKEDALETKELYDKIKSQVFVKS